MAGPVKNRPIERKVGGHQGPPDLCFDVCNLNDRTHSSPGLHHGIHVPCATARIDAHLSHDRVGIVPAGLLLDGGFRRGTSTTRTDSGNGACETIFVDEFQLIASMSTPWRAGFTVGWVTLTLVALLWLWLVMSGRLQHRARN